MADKETHKPVSGEAGFDPTKEPGYQEYPKVVVGYGGGLVTVASKEDEDRVKAAPKAEPAAAPEKHPHAAPEPESHKPKAK
jgi:hypothetical protein